MSRQRSIYSSIVEEYLQSQTNGLRKVTSRDLNRLTMDDSFRGAGAFSLPRYLPAVRALGPEVEGLAAKFPPVDRPNSTGATATAAPVVAAVPDAAVRVERGAAAAVAAAGAAASSANVAAADPGAGPVGDLLVDVLGLAAAAALRLAAAAGAVVLVGRRPLVVVPVTSLEWVTCSRARREGGGGKKEHILWRQFAAECGGAASAIQREMR